MKYLEVRDLKIYFGEPPNVVKAVDGLSFDLYRGETLGIVGESGSGKSITALAIMDLLPAAARRSSGTIRFWSKGGEAKILEDLLPAQRRIFNGGRLGMVFQEPMSSLNPVFNCGEQVAEALQLHRGLSVKEAKAFTLALFEKVQLPEPNRIYRSYPHQLSGGQKQRVMIAMALSCNPQLIICDEPTTALDVSVQRGILDLLNTLKKEGQTSFIFISHDLGVIAEVADRAIVMYRGEIVESGLLADLFSQPKHPYTKGLLACRPRLNMSLDRLPVLADFMKEEEEEGGIGELPAPRERTRPAIIKDKTPLLSVSDLKVWYTAPGGMFGKKTTPVKAVDGISFDLFPGEIMGLVGESGCGKTTLGKAIVRLAPITSGAIRYKDRAIHGLEGKSLRQLRKEIQIIFQDPYGSLNPRLRVGVAIMEPLLTLGLCKTKTAARKRAEELLELVQLPVGVFDRYPHEFSGGQRQRIGIARALAVEPDFLICDESVSSLDVSIQAQILNLLLDLREELGLTYLFISHDLSVVQFFSDRIMVMQKGKLVEQGDAQTIYQNPQSDYTRRLIEAIPSPDFD